MVSKKVAIDVDVVKELSSSCPARLLVCITGEVKVPCFYSKESIFEALAVPYFATTVVGSGAVFLECFLPQIFKGTSNS